MRAGSSTVRAGSNTLSVARTLVWTRLSELCSPQVNTLQTFFESTLPYCRRTSKGQSTCSRHRYVITPWSARVSRESTCTKSPRAVEQDRAEQNREHRRAHQSIAEHSKAHQSTTEHSKAQQSREAEQRRARGKPE